MQEGPSVEYALPVNGEMEVPQEGFVVSSSAEHIDANTLESLDARERVEQHEIAAEVMLARIEIENAQLDHEVDERFGEGFVDKVKEKGKAWLSSMEVKGNAAIAWAEKRGVALPETKLGMRILAGTMGTVGAVVPGLGVLLPPAYLLWKRGATMGSAASTEIPALA